MGAPTVANILRLRGALVWNPTNLSAAFPYGGTRLGLTRGAEFAWNVRVGDITAEEWGGRCVEAVYAGDAAVLAAVLRDYDSDALANIFPNTVTGAGGGLRVQATTANNGILLSSRKGRLLFVPHAVDAHPFVYLPAAVPAPDAAVRLQMNAGVEIGIAAVWRAIPDSTGRLYLVGKRADITL